MLQTLFTMSCDYYMTFNLFQNKAESCNMEIRLSKNEAVNALNELDSWMKPKQVSYFSLSSHNFFKKIYIIYIYIYMCVCVYKSLSYGYIKLTNQ